MKLEEYGYKIIHKLGKGNTNALSRYPVINEEMNEIRHCEEEEKEEDDEDNEEEKEKTIKEYGRRETVNLT